MKGAPLATDAAARLLAAELAVIEAACRHMNLTAAGRELGLGQSVMSRRIAAVEAALGVPIFLRDGRRLRLSPQGAALLPAIRAASDRLEAAVAMLGAAGPDEVAGTLRLGTLPTFAAAWLAPRLAGFAARHPAVAIDLSTIGADFADGRKDAVTWDGEAVDAVISWGRGGWRGFAARRLFDERVIPVAAPGLALPDDPARLGREGPPLIRHTTRADLWPDWAGAAGLPPQGFRPSPQGAGADGAAGRRAEPRFEHFFMILAAAVAGLGIALVPEAFARADLAAGRLQRVAPALPALRSGAAYWLITTDALSTHPRIRAFREWITEEAAGRATETPQSLAE